MAKIQENDLELKRLQKSLRGLSFLDSMGLSSAEVEGDLSQVFVTNPRLSGMHSRSNRVEQSERRITDLKANFAKKNNFTSEAVVEGLGADRQTAADLMAELGEGGEEDLFGRYERFKRENYGGCQGVESAELEYVMKDAPRDETLRELWMDRELDRLLRLKERELMDLRAASNPETDALVERMKAELRGEETAGEVDSSLDEMLVGLETWARERANALRSEEEALVEPELLPCKTYHEMVTDLAADPKVTTYLERKERNENSISSLKLQAGKLTRRASQRRHGPRRPVHPIPGRGAATDTGGRRGRRAAQ